MNDKKQNAIPQTVPVQSSTFSQTVNAEIRRAAATGIYDIRGGGAKRKVPHFDDLLFLGASFWICARGVNHQNLMDNHETVTTELGVGFFDTKTNGFSSGLSTFASKTNCF